MKLFATDEDVVFIEGLTVNAVLGLYDWERTITQPVVIDMALYTDTTIVATSNDLNKGVNYKEVCECVTAWTIDLQAELIEDLIEVLAKKVLENFSVNKITIKIGKPIAISNANLVGVQVTRKQHEII